MSVATMPPTRRPLPKMPSGAFKDDVWLDTDGVLRKHDIELPVDKDTRRINARLFACVVADCPTAEWVLEPETAPKTKFCPRDHGPNAQLLAAVPLDDTQADPVAVGRQRQQAWLAGMLADRTSRMAETVREAIAVRTAALKDSARQGLAELGTDMKGHVPSLAASAAIEIGVIYTVDLAGALESAAIAANLLAWGAIVGYLVAVQAEKLRLWRRGEHLEGRAAKKARVRGLHAARAIAGTGAYLAATAGIDAVWGLDATSGWQTSFLALLGLALAWVVNKAHWDRLWADRKRIRRLAEEARIRAAEAEARRLEEEARRLAEEAELRGRLADVGAYDEDNPLHMGERMKIEWERIGRLPTAREGFPQIDATWIVPDQTRAITAPDPDTGELVRVGWEFLGQCKPGALISRGMPVPPVMAAKEWVVSVLEEGRYDPSMISLLDRPGNRQNTFLLMITEKARLGEAVNWKGHAGIRVDASGVRYGHLGRSLTGEDLEEVLYAPGQPMGGMVTGTTGGGKGVHATRYILNCLAAKILPVLFDPKGLVDFADFVGIFPIGFTEEHRNIILLSLRAERERRQAVLAKSPKKNRYGAEVKGESKWQCRCADGTIGPFGEPIASVWDEFHDLVKDQKFLGKITNQARFQRAAAIGQLLLSQGGGLNDFGDSVLRGLMNQTSLTSYRADDLQSRLGGNKNSAYSTSDLPMLPGMCLRQATGSPDIPLRGAFQSRDPQAEDSVFTWLWGKGGTKVLQIEDPMNWISDETRALWEKTGLMEVWRKARGEKDGRTGTWLWNGLDTLLADAPEPGEEDLDPQEREMQALMRSFTQPAGAVTAAPSGSTAGNGRMVAREVLAGILHEDPGLDLDAIQAHSAWRRAPGWAGPPVLSTITRRANDLDPSVGGTIPLAEGAKQLIDRGPRSKFWTLTEAGKLVGAAAAAQFAPVSPGVSPAAAAGVWIGPAGGDVATVERNAQREAELAQIAAAETRAAERPER